MEAETPAQLQQHLYDILTEILPSQAMDRAETTRRATTTGDG